MIALIKRRFGRADQQERYRSELQRLRQGRLTLEQLHYQVRELAHRAYPTAPASVVDIIARDAYGQALDNAEMRLRIRTAVPVPETLEDVVRVAGQLEVWLAPAVRDDSAALIGSVKWLLMRRVTPTRAPILVDVLEADRHVGLHTRIRFWKPLNNSSLS